MAKDWDYYKATYISNRLEEFYETIKLVDDVAHSPIEKIAILQCMRVRDFVGLMNSQLNIQYSFKEYYADILFTYLPTDTKIVIECDGHDFHEKTKEQASRDKRRDREFQTAGFIVLRYSGSDIVNDPTQMRIDILNIAIPGWNKENQSNEKNETQKGE